MTYQPYPTGGGSSDIVEQQRGPRPQSLRTAVILMYVGAGLSAIAAVFSLAASGRIKTAIGNALRDAKTRRPMTAAQIHTFENAYLVVIVVVLVVGIALWLWMAWANGRGKSWARILATVLFGLNTLYILLAFVSVLRRGRTSTTLLFTALEWLVGLAALVLLWRGDSTQYFTRSQ